MHNLFIQQYLKKTSCWGCQWAQPVVAWLVHHRKSKDYFQSWSLHELLDHMMRCTHTYTCIIQTHFSPRFTYRSALERTKRGSQCELHTYCIRAIKCYSEYCIWKSGQVHSSIHRCASWSCHWCHPPCVSVCLGPSAKLWGNLFPLLLAGEWQMQSGTMCHAVGCCTHIRIRMHYC